MGTDMNNRERVIPLTSPGPLWSQREYVACMQLNIGFAAHRHGETRQAFHYRFPDCCTTIITGTGVDRYIDHEWQPNLDWITRCSKAAKDEA